jgi:hypothetical protein
MKSGIAFIVKEFRCFKITPFHKAVLPVIHPDIIPLCVIGDYDDFFIGDGIADGFAALFRLLIDRNRGVYNGSHTLYDIVYGGALLKVLTPRKGDKLFLRIVVISEIKLYLRVHRAD